MTITVPPDDLFAKVAAALLQDGQLDKLTPQEAVEAVCRTGQKFLQEAGAVELKFGALGQVFLVHQDSTMSLLLQRATAEEDQPPPAWQVGPDDRPRTRRTDPSAIGPRIG